MFGANVFLCHGISFTLRFLWQWWRQDLPDVGANVSDMGLNQLGTTSLLQLPYLMVQIITLFFAKIIAKLTGDTSLFGLT